MNLAAVLLAINNGLIPRKDWNALIYMQISLHMHTIFKLMARKILYWRPARMSSLQLFEFVRICRWKCAVEWMRVTSLLSPWFSYKNMTTQEQWAVPLHCNWPPAQKHGNDIIYSTCKIWESCWAVGGFSESETSVPNLLSCVLLIFCRFLCCCMLLPCNCTV